MKASFTRKHENRCGRGVLRNQWFPLTPGSPLVFCWAASCNCGEETGGKRGQTHLLRVSSGARMFFRGADQWKMRLSPLSRPL